MVREHLGIKLVPSIPATVLSNTATINRYLSESLRPEDRPIPVEVVRFAGGASQASIPMLTSHPVPFQARLSEGNLDENILFLYIGIHDEVSETQRTKPPPRRGVVDLRCGWVGRPGYRRPPILPIGALACTEP